MKTYKNSRLLWFWGVVCCGILNACSGGKEDAPQPTPALVVSESVLQPLAEGQTHRVIIQFDGEWTIGGETDWCKPNKKRGSHTDTVLITVAENIFREARTCELTVKPQTGEQSHIQVKQEGARKDHLYRLPVVFHVLYENEQDINQNINGAFFESLLPDCNLAYRQGHNGLDLGVEFYMATHDPEGRQLAEPGIHRVPWRASSMSCYEFIQSSDAGDVALIWKPSEYVNVVVFRFTEGSGLSAISTMPFTVSWDPLSGLRNGDAYFGRAFGEVYCIAFNTQYIIRPQAGKTLAHELGHYLGLFHVFSDADELQTDYCGDTPNYNRAAYMQEAQRIIAAEGPDSPRLYERTGDKGEVFVSRNMMDYEYTYQDEFTPDQYKRVRHVLENSPLIPGPKKMAGPKEVKSGYPLPSALIAR